MFEMIREYKESLKSKPKEPTRQVNLSENILINPSAFKNRLYNLESISDEELIGIIKNCYMVIFDERFIKESESHIKLMTQPKFINACIYAFNNIQVPAKVKIYANKIIYDFTTVYNTDEFEYVRNMLFSLGRVVNKDKLYTLISIGLPEAVSLQLLISRYSSVKESTNIARLNYCICKQDESLMTEQMIIWIYEKLFDKISEVFQVTMFYPYDETQNELIYSTIALSVLDIIENMPYIALKNLLRDYTLAYESGAYRRKVVTKDNDIIPIERTYIRFSLDTICRSDYPRVLSAVDELRAENVYVP